MDNSKRKPIEALVLVKLHHLFCDMKKAMSSYNEDFDCKYCTFEGIEDDNDKSILSCYLKEICELVKKGVNKEEVIKPIMDLASNDISIEFASILIKRKYQKLSILYPRPQYIQKIKTTLFDMLPFGGM